MGIRVAVAQMEPRLGGVGRNLDAIAGAIGRAKADLVVFPECALAGYGFETAAEGLRFSEPVPGPSTERIAAACRSAGSWAIVGLLERGGGGAFYNSAVLIGPPGIAGTYRKMHLPFLGVDRFATPGDLGFPVYEAGPARIGMLVCYDLSFPEAARILKLGGAQVVCVPTNWPEAAAVSCDLSPVVRAQENHLHVVTANRIGEEAGFRFPGRSRICDFSGTVLALAGAGEETITAELDPAAADRNRVVNVPGRYELDRIAHRRPEHYRRLALPTPETGPPLRP